MGRKTLQIKDFRHDSTFYPTLHLLLTVKSFDLQAIRKRYLASKQNPNQRAGSMARREPAMGGVVEATIAHGQITAERVLVRLREPRGIVYGNGLLALSSENEVWVVSGADASRITHPWFSYIHTVCFSGDQERLLVSSSGLDYIAEFDLATGRPTFEWLAWEHGFAKGFDPESGAPVHLTRDAATARQWEAERKNVLLIEDPARQTLPTACRAAFINSVCYDTDAPGCLLATFFHKGGIYQIDAQSKKADLMLDGLDKPHGGRRAGSALMATSTAAGEIVMQQGDDAVAYSVRGLDGKPDHLQSSEWVQNALLYQGLVLAIDSNRTALVIFDPGQGLYDLIPYSPDWAIQDGVCLSEQPDSKTCQVLSGLG